MVKRLAVLLLASAAALGQTAKPAKPRAAAAAYSEGEDYFNKKDYAKALAAYDRAIQLDPKQP